MSLGIFLMKKSMAKNDRARDKKIPIPNEVDYQRDIPYREDLKNSPVLDVYKPKRGKDDYLPVIVSIHGGAYCYGSTDVYLRYCASLAKEGFAVISFNYTLAPKAKFPK